MRTDYEKIREENIARYGWDTAVLDLLGQLYSERTHFIFELIQNAEDAGATELAFELFEDRLELRHDGRPFTEADVRGVCGVGQGGKSGDLTAIGKFGIGFKSVYAYTRSPRVYSSAEHFRIENYVRPFPVEPLPGAGTLFVFPFDHDTVPAAAAVREIAAALTAIQPRILLFLRSIGRLRVRVRGAGGPGSVIERSVAGGGWKRRVTVSVGRGHRDEEWLVWHRPVEGHEAQRIEIAFRLEAGRIVPVSDSPLTVFFPTEKETFLGFLVQGPYRTTPARDNVPGHDPSNQALVLQTAALLTEVLRALRDDGLLTVQALQALPLDAARFPAGSMFRPLFDSVGEALTTEALIPVAEGGHGVAVDLELAGGAEMHELLDPDQLGALCGADRPVWFADESITEHLTPVLWRYLREEIGIDVVTPADVVSRVTREFLQAQTDEWITRFYVFLFADSALWRAPRSDGEQPGPARVKPIIRLEDGSQVAPFDSQDRPAVYLPGPAASSLPTVRRAIADSPAARQFLAALNLAEPDVVAEVLQVILPRYDELDIAALDPARHDTDLECVVRALDEVGGPTAGRREELIERLRRAPFLIGENAATGEQRLAPPPGLYQRSKELEVYFEGNPDIWFAGDRYGPWLVQLRGMGVRQAVEVRARTPDPLGHVVIAVEFGRSERGLDGFDPGAEIDGLDFALRHPGHARSEYVWNVLLAPNRRLVAGLVERSVLASFSDSSTENARSAIAVAAEREAWLPGRDETFRRPAELSLDDLPPAYTRDEGLAQALNMLRPVVAQAARQLGISPEVLWGLSAHPDLAAMIERELATRAAAGRSAEEDAQVAHEPPVA
ncbi:MAG: sacsin N-terminal ATP-binding-like domain-containing protein [Streptosporangiaceae bacterium]